MGAHGEERASRPIERLPPPELTESEKHRKVAENNIRQFDRMIGLITEGLREPYYRLRPSAILELNRVAVDGLVSPPGSFRQTEMTIDGSGHQPPCWTDVPKHIDEMCEYIDANWIQPAVHLASYVMWRLNWIHPFEDGNGRTSRAVSYLVLSVRLGLRLPGKSTIPDRIAAQKQPYYAALEAADASLARGKIDVSEMEKLIGDLLAQQVVDAA